MENLEMPGNLAAVRELSENSQKVRPEKCQGKIQKILSCVLLTSCFGLFWAVFSKLVVVVGLILPCVCVAIYLIIVNIFVEYALTFIVYW